MITKTQTKTLLETKSTKDLLIEAKVMYLDGDHNIVFTFAGVALICSLFIKHNDQLVRDAVLHILLKDIKD